MRHPLKAALFFVVIGGMLVLAGAGTPGAGEEGSQPQPKVSEVAVEKIDGSKRPQDGACLVDEAAIEDLRKQRESWAARIKELATRENELKAREAALNEEFRKFEALRGDLSKVEVSRKQENDARVAKLVETFETMSPKAASALLAGLDESLAVAAMAKISTLKLAKIMNVMEPKRSARLTELMAGVVQARDAAGRRSGSMSNDVEETTSVPTVPGSKAGTGGRELKKGGEKT